MNRAPSHPKILCVEDNPEVCETLESVLSELPASVVSALNADSAMDLLIAAKQACDPFQLVVLDMWVPKSDGEPIAEDMGLQLLEKLLLQQKIFQLLSLNGSVVIFTAHPDYRQCVKCIRGGAVDYILKTDLETKADNTEALFNRCRELVYPDLPSDQVRDWLDHHYDELAREFAGKVLAVLDPDAAALGSIKCKSVAQYAVFAGDSFENVRDELLNDKVLRWEQPRIVTIQAVEEVSNAS